MNKKPNIIVFMTDQQVADTVHDWHMAKTPNVDRLKKTGVHFTHSFCTAPHCCPSRASFFTGLYPSEHNIWNNVENNSAFSRDFYDDIVTFPELLQQDGYRTIFSGKWHVSGYDGPSERGFDEVLHEYISNHGRMKPENKPSSLSDWAKHYSDASKVDTQNTEKEFGRIIRPGYPKFVQFGEEENPFGDNTTVEKACNRLQTMNEEEPFFMYIGTVGPHDPYCLPKEFLDLYDINDIELPANFYDDMEKTPNLYQRTRNAFRLTEEEHKESIRHYLAFCSYEDSLFGKVLDTLEEKNMMENTIVIYTSDHGDYVGAHGLWAKGLPCYREAYNICSIIGGAGIVNGNRQESAMISITDFAPTILELAGVLNENHVTGKSIVPFLKGESPSEWREYLFTQTNGNELFGIQRSVFSKQWKFVYNGFDFDQLFDLTNDPLEMVNVVDVLDYQEVLKQMWKELWKFTKATKDMTTSPYIMVALAPFGPGILLEDS